MLHHYFDQIYCINLDRRPDRWEHCQQEFSKHGIEQVTRFSAVDAKQIQLPFDAMYNAELSCTLSHLKVLEQAIATAAERVLILEDDVVFHDRLGEFFDHYWRQLPLDWDVCLMGGNHIEPPQPITANLLKTRRTYALHAYSVHQKSLVSVQQYLAHQVQKILQHSEKSTFSAAPDFLIADLQPSFNFYSFSPPLAWQLEGYSDLQSAIVSYDCLQPQTVTGYGAIAQSPSSPANQQSIQTITQDRFQIADLPRLEQALQDISELRTWRSQPHAICYYGATPYAATVRLLGLAQAAQDWKIPFVCLQHGQEEAIESLRQTYPNLLLIVSNPERLSYIEPLLRSPQNPNTKLVIFGRYIDEAPSTDLYVANMCDAEKVALKQYASRIDLAISELSLEGNAYLLRPYMLELGIPVMSFPWGVNLTCHTPTFARAERDLLFVGTFSEKGSRIKQFWAEPLKRFSQLLIGPDWTQSPFSNTHNSVLSTQEFNQQAPYLYSSSTIALNLHHAFEVEGFTCNERVFNAPACGGFVVSDRARRIRDFLGPDELVMADNPREYLEAIEYFVQYPERRYPYMRKAIETLYRHHTYHHRLADLLAVVFRGQPISSFCPVMDFVQF
ncbi:MAG: hypothetical protein EA001_05625 [Oscillatoriales cyanobacterium]|nr:MAG: hypothetical protein EA001_05625 [Oscillatoriales cyanobacterium]